MPTHRVPPRVPQSYYGLDKQRLSQPSEVLFCQRCVVSNQRPRIAFDSEGICSACRFMEHQYSIIDWQDREDQLKALLNRHRRTDGRWDVVVPASGGKDSSTIAHKLQQVYGMHPLTVTWAPFRRTDIGQKNFENFIDAGFTNIEGHPNGKLHRALSRFCFEQLGDAWQPFAYGQMTFPFHIALKFGIRLVMYGENGEATYGGDPKNNDLPGMPLPDWNDLYWKGMNIQHLVSSANTHVAYLPPYHESDLEPYKPPLLPLLESAGIEMHWLGYYQKWVPQENFYWAAEHTGFKVNPSHSEGTYSKYSSLDDKMDGFHYYMAYVKFGIGRATSDAAHEIRDGHITREEGVALVRRYDGQFPHRYFQDFLEYLDITADQFWNTVDRWRPEHLWAKDGDHWRLKHQVQ